MEGMREGVDFQEVKRQSITVQLIKIHQCQPIILGVISLTHNVLENSPSNSVYSCILNDSSEKREQLTQFWKTRETNFDDNFLITLTGVDSKLWVRQKDLSVGVAESCKADNPLPKKQNRS